MGQAAPRKYDVDYSRFDGIEDSESGGGEKAVASTTAAASTTLPPPIPFVDPELAAMQEALRLQISGDLTASRDLVRCVEASMDMRAEMFPEPLDCPDFDFADLTDQES